MDLVKLSKGIIIFGILITVLSGVFFGMQPSEQDIENNNQLTAAENAKEVGHSEDMKAIATVGMGIGNFLTLMGVFTFIAFRKPSQSKK